MIKLVDWNEKVEGKDIAEWFIKLGNLDEIDAEIIRGRRDRKYQFEVASNVNVSLDTVKNRTAKLIVKYKRLMKRYPNILKVMKDYRNVSAIISIMTPDNMIYSVALDNENFDTFIDIREYVMNALERQYNIKLDELSEYKTIIGGSFDKKIL